MEVLIVFLVTLFVAVPVVAVVALCYAIGARRRVEELQDSLSSLRLEVQRLGEDSGGRAPVEPGKPHSKAETFRQARATDRPRAEEVARDDLPYKTETGKTEDEASWSQPAAVGGVPLEEESPSGETFPLEAPLQLGDPMARLVEALRRFGCLPPADDDRVEASLGAWWATRLGIVMAVIAAVFFGVYVSQNTPPWVRFVAVLLVGFGVALAGLRLERTIGAFGRVVFAGGLGIVYFAAFAAYAVPAMRVAAGPVSGGILQALAVGLIFAASVWKERESIAAMAVFLGYVSCLFAFGADLETFAWGGGMLLGAGAGALLLARNWRYPLAIALVGAWAVVALLVLTVWLEGEAPSFGFAMTLLAGQFVFFLIFERIGRQQNKGYAEQARCLFHFFNSTAVLILGWFFVREGIPESLAWFYLIFGVLLLLVWGMFRHGREPELLTNGYFVKGASLVALFVITYFSGEVRWIVLLVQAACLLPLLREHLRVSIDVVFHAVLAAAVGLFLYELSSAAGPHVFWSLPGLMALGFALGLPVVLAVRRRFLPDSCLENHPSELLAVVGQVAVGVVAIAYVQAFFEPLGRVGFALAFAVLLSGMDLTASSSRRWFIAGTIAGIYAYATYLLGWPGDAGRGMTVLAGVWVAGAFFCASVVVSRMRFRETFPAARLELLLHASWLFVVTLMLFRVVAPEWFLFSAILATCAVYLLSRGVPGATPAVLSGLVYFFAICFWVVEGQFPASATAAWLSLALAAGYMLATGGTVPVLATDLPEGDKHRSVLEWSGGLAATIAVLVAVHHTVFDAGQATVLAAAAIAGTLAWRWRKVTPWAYLSVVLMAAAHLASYRYIGNLWLADQAATGGAFLWVAVFPALLVVAMGLLLTRPAAWPSDDFANRWWSICGLAGLGLPFFAVVHRAFGLLDYATIVWGTAAIALFVTGLVFRAQPYRLIALGGVGLGVIRLFAVDIQDTLNRIIAFAVLGLVLLGIGFLYHRFRHRLLDTATDRGEGESG